MADHLTLQFKSTLQSMSSASDAASQWLADRGGSEEVQYLTNLAIEELGTNCIKFGYDIPGDHTIEVELSLSDRDFVLTFTDDGRPFNPLLLPEPDVALAAEERSIGGLGIFLLRRMADRFEYAREGNKNVVTLFKTSRSC